MKVEEFDSILNQNSIGRFNVKVILCNSYEDVFNLKKIFFRANYEIKDLREYQKDKNRWFGVSKLKNIVKNLNKDTLFFSISEIIRFYNSNDFRNFFSDIFLIENKKINIYIPLFGLSSRFYSEYYNNFYRKNEYKFVYELDSINNSIDLNIVNFDVPFENRLDTISDWLNFYNHPQNNIICSPTPLVERIDNQSSDDLININYISNQKEFITKYMKKEFLVNFKEDEKEFWQKLIIDLKDNNLKELMKKKLNIFNLNSSEILNRVCSENDNYLKWLLKGYSLSEIDKDSYFYRVIKNSNIDEPLINRVWFNIFDEFNLSHAKERFEILTNFYINNIPTQNIEDKLREYLKNSEKLTAILTGITKIEKEYIIKLYKEQKVDSEFLKKYYKNMFYYLDKIDFENPIDWVDEYFSEYKKSKLLNQISQKLELLLKEKNSSKESFFNWYSSVKFKSINDFKDYNCLWIDGLGVEWLGVINNYIKDKGFKVEFFLSTSKLPSTTKCNRFGNIKKIEKLDNYIHEQKSYKYPINLIEEIEIIKNIVNENLEDELIIVSDHGFSAFCSFKAKINSFDDEHEGRCAKAEQEIVDNNYFSHNFECGKYLVALNHNSLNNKTRREAHGGATPEEVIVPIIKISKELKENKAEVAKVEIKQGFQEDELF